MDNNKLFNGKISAPSSAAVTMTRSRLTNCLNQSVSYNIHSMIAPAGFGKTTLMLDWSDQRTEKSVWYTIEQSDNDPLSFWSGLLMAFSCSEVHTPRYKDRMTRSDAKNRSDYWHKQFINELEESIGEVDEPINLILDDLHFLDDPETIESLAQTMRFLPANIRLHLLSRKPLPVEILSYVSWDKISQIDANSLVFTLDEAIRYVRLMITSGTFEKSISSDSGGIDSFVKKTWQQSEGWPTIFCSMVSNKLNKTRTLFNNGCYYASAEFHHYIETHILPFTTPQLRNKVRSLAPVNCFNQALFAECLFPGESAGFYRGLIAERGLVVRLANCPDDYSVRQPLREYFKHCGKASDRLSIHNKAYRWYLSNHRFDETITLCIDGGYWQSAVHLIEELYDTLADAGHWKKINDWFEKLPMHIVEKRPLLLMLLGRKALFQGLFDSAIDYFNLANARLSDERPIDHPENLYSMENSAQLRLIVEDLNVSTLSLCSSVTTDGLSNDDESLQSIFHKGLVAQQRNQFDSAIKCFKVVLEQALISQQGMRLKAIASLGWVLHLKGETDISNKLQFSLRNQVGIKIEYSQESAWLSYSAVFEYLESSSTEEAKKCLQDAKVLRDPCFPVDIRFNLLVAQVMLAMQEERWNDANELISEAELLSQKMPLATQRNLYSLPALQAEVLLAQGKKEDAFHKLHSLGRHNVDQSIVYQHESLIKSTILFAMNKPQESLDEATLVKEWAEKYGAGTLLTKARLAQALALKKLKRTEKSLRVFDDALHMGRITGNVRSFVQVGLPEMKLLLVESKKQGRYPAYICRLLKYYESDIESVLDEKTDISTLSKREHQVLGLLATGMSNPEIAQSLCRSLGTVKIHVHNIYRKLGARNRVAAINKYMNATI